MYDFVFLFLLSEPPTYSEIVHHHRSDPLLVRSAVTAPSPALAAAASLVLVFQPFMFIIIIVEFNFIL